MNNAISYSDIKRYEDLPAEKYFNLGGFSHSRVKNDNNGTYTKFEPTPKMMIGSLTDAILTEKPDKINIASEYFPVCRKFAISIRDQFGPMIDRFVPQVCYTSTMKYMGLQMDTTGRLDWELKKLATIDLKMTSVTTKEQFLALIKYMGYENQLWNYAKMQGVDRAYIFPFSTKLNKMLPVIPIDCTSDYNDFWAKAVLKHGESK